MQNNRTKATSQAIAQATPDFTKAIEELCIIAEQNGLKLNVLREYKICVNIFYRSCRYN